MKKTLARVAWQKKDSSPTCKPQDLRPIGTADKFFSTLLCMDRQHRNEETEKGEEEVHGSHPHHRQFLPLGRVAWEMPLRLHLPSAP